MSRAAPKQETATGRYLMARTMVPIQLDELKNDVSRSFAWNPETAGCSPEHIERLAASLERLLEQVAEMRMKLMAFENSQRAAAQETPPGRSRRP